MTTSTQQRYLICWDLEQDGETLTPRGEQTDPATGQTLLTFDGFTLPKHTTATAHDVDSGREADRLSDQHGWCVDSLTADPANAR